MTWNVISFMLHSSLFPFWRTLRKVFAVLSSSYFLAWSSVNWEGGVPKYRSPFSALPQAQPTWAAEGGGCTNPTHLEMPNFKTMLYKYKVFIDMGLLHIWQKPHVFLASLSKILSTGYTWPLFRQSQWYWIHISGSSLRAAFLLTKRVSILVGLASLPRDCVLIASGRWGIFAVGLCPDKNNNKVPNWISEMTWKKIRARWPRGRCIVHSMCLPWSTVIGFSLSTSGTCPISQIYVGHNGLSW